MQLKNSLWHFLSLCLIYGGLFGQSTTTPTIFDQQGARKGLLLFAPLFSKTTYLIDYNGVVMKTWVSRYNPGQSVYLLPSGELLRTGNDSSRYFFGGGGVLEIFDKKGNIKWQYHLSDSMQRQHHDVCPLPNGNLLVLCWEKISREEALRKGRRQVDKMIWSEKIIELKPEGTNGAKVIWQWRLWDHLIQNVDKELPEYANAESARAKLDINFLANETADWLHFNSLDYNPESDQVLISNRNLSEIYIIDHSTTTQEAASGEGGRSGKGGDFLYRWGNPMAYGGGKALDQQLFRQHHATWIKKDLKGAGSILLFNNGVQRKSDGEEYSSVLSLSPLTDSSGEYLSCKGRFLPEEPDWIYQAKERGTFFSFNVSSAQRLPGGNTMICEGAEGRFFEVTEEGKIVWEYKNPYGVKLAPERPEIQNQVFRCTWFDWKDPAIKSLNLSPPGKKPKSRK